MLKPYSLGEEESRREKEDILSKGAYTLRFGYRNMYRHSGPWQWVSCRTCVGLSSCIRKSAARIQSIIQVFMQCLVFKIEPATKLKEYGGHVLVTKSFRMGGLL